MIEPNPTDSPIPEPAFTALLAIYAALDAEVARRGPRCQLSGRCCRFEEFGHTLFVSRIEAEMLVDQAPAPSRPLDAGLTCPWQDAHGRCAARQARPLGCRAYFCDPAYEPTAHEVSEPHITKLKQLARDYDLPWSYQPLHHHLRRLREEGRLVVDLAP